MRKLGALAVLCAAGLAQADQLTVNLDCAKTQILWVLSGNVHTVHGTFHLKQGQVVLDTATGNMSGALIADAASGQSGNGSRDRRMQADVLESSRFPEMRLTPRTMEGAISPAGQSTVRISGTFLLHGTGHEVTIPLRVEMSAGDLKASGKFSVPYVAWGLKDPSNFLFKVDKAVEVEFVTVGRMTAK